MSAIVMVMLAATVVVGGFVLMLGLPILDRINTLF